MAANSELAPTPMAQVHEPFNVQWISDFPDFYQQRTLVALMNFVIRSKLLRVERPHRAKQHFNK